MADIKSLLKDARKLIDEKDYKAAQECCKNILQKDKENYFGLVLLGKAFQDSDQAPKAYQKAIEVKPEHPLAWQGLANFYERKEKDSDKTVLFTIYSGVLNSQLEEEKGIGIISKVTQLGCALKSDKSLRTLMKYLEKQPVTNIHKAAKTAMIELLNAGVQLTDIDVPSLLKNVHNIYIENPNDSLEMLQCNIILNYKSDFSLAVEEIISKPFFSTNSTLREWLCKQICIKYVEKMSFGNFNIEKYIDVISEGILHTKYQSLLRNIICYDKGLYIEAYTQSVQLINYDEVDVTEAIFLIRCTIMLKKWSLTQKLVIHFLTKVKDINFSMVLKRFLVLSLTNQQKWKQAILAAKDIPIDVMDSLDLAVLAECCIEDNEPVDHLMKHLETSPYFKQLQALLFLKEKRYDEVIDLLEDSVDNSLHVLYVGKAYWELKQFDKCIINLLKAAKLNPDHADTFLYLGYYYRDHKNDLEKAKKCFEKAYNINPNSHIGKNLSEIYLKLHLNDADFQFLQMLTKSLPTMESWIDLRLGLHYLRKREWENAISHFRNVIKTDHNSMIAFECLADAYYSRGAFTSALRAYNKVMSLDTNRSVHCLTNIGYIHSLLTQYDAAIKTFEQVFKIDSSSTLALKGMAETWMRVAKKKADAKSYGSARDCVQHAIDYILKALLKQNQYLCFWKLLADNLMFITKLPNKYAYVYMPSLSKESDNLEVSRREKLEIYPQAIACYSHIAKQKEQTSSYDLATAYLKYYYETKILANGHLSFQLTVNCIKEKSTSWRNWNLLGKICLAIKKYKTAQHCFIKALKIIGKWSSAKVWCNLGALYLKLELYTLANHCFSRGQSVFPSYPQSWVGQALIAEVIREDEAMDLFRHASRLGFHPESALGYADWVCRSVKNNKYKANSESKYVIEGLYAIPYAIDLMEWFCHFDCTNGCAYNILGLLQERQGLLRSALCSYEKAYEYVDEGTKDNVLLNKGRLLFRMEKYEEAIKMYKAITEASLHSTAGLALALFKIGLYEESYSVYNTALEWLSKEENDKADLLVAMAGIIYMFKGAGEAKLVLFHSIQISQKKPTPHSLFAICSLGLIASDQSLVKLALGELKKFKDVSEYSFDIGFLKSYQPFCDDNIDHAIKLLSNSIHNHPSNALLWFCVTQYCLQTEKAKAKVASCCAQKALCNSQFGDYDSTVAKILASASVAEQMAGDYTNALLLANKGRHMYPNQAEVWVALLYTLSSDSSWFAKQGWFILMTSQLRRYINMPRQLNTWVTQLEKQFV